MKITDFAFYFTQRPNLLSHPRKEILNFSKWMEDTATEQRSAMDYRKHKEYCCAAQQNRNTCLPNFSQKATMCVVLFPNLS
jgi:hypothetical protein